MTVTIDFCISVISTHVVGSSGEQDLPIDCEVCESDHELFKEGTVTECRKVKNNLYRNCVRSSDPRRVECDSCKKGYYSVQLDGEYSPHVCKKIPVAEDQLVDSLKGCELAETDVDCGICNHKYFMAENGSCEPRDENEVPCGCIGGLATLY